jgi:transcriptional regulator with XRE-family HTH domain
MKNYIGKNIRKYRKLRGFTQEELACELGVTSQAVSRWEAGSGMPDISFIVSLAQNLGVTTNILFGMADNKMRSTHIFISVRNLRKSLCVAISQSKHMFVKKVLYFVKKYVLYIMIIYVYKSNTIYRKVYILDERQSNV